MKTWKAVIGLSAAFLLMCGCDGTFVNHRCNVSFGPTQGILIHNSNNCIQPGLVVLPDGNLLAAYQCDFTTLTTQLSSDNGATWGSANTFPLGSNYVALSLLPNGNLFLSTSKFDRVPLPFYMIGTIGHGDAISWGPPVFVSTPTWKNGCMAGSPVVRLSNGNLLWPLACLSDNDESAGLPNSSTVLLSADGGLTWPTQITVGDSTADKRDYDESAAAVYPNGDIIMIMRQTTKEPAGMLWRSKSTDNGLSWSKPVLVVNREIVGRPTLALLPSGGLVLLGRAVVKGVSTTGFATSWDEGLTYSDFADLAVRGPVGNFDQYDAMALLSDGSIGVVGAHGEVGKNSNVDFRNLVDYCSSAPSVLSRNYEPMIDIKMQCSALAFAD